MEKTAKALADYVIRKGVVDEEDRNIYEFGFAVTMEVGLFALFCMFVSLYLHMFMQGVLFFIVFAPLRSYAGGLHLEKYHSCFVLSCLTFSGILLTVSYIQFPIWISFITLFILEIAVYVLYPVENINRKVDKEEDTYFRKKLKSVLLMDVIIAVVCIILNDNMSLSLVTDTFLIVDITMLIGKHKNRKRCLTGQ